MKYYTPDLLKRFASADERVALAAQDTLERRTEQYADYFDGIAAKLPPRFREMQASYYLHDAVVDSPSPAFLREMPGAKQIRLASFILTVQLDAPPKEYLVLHYRDVLLESLSPTHDDRSATREWRHDEVRLIRRKRRTEFEHSILFSDGTELRIRFVDFDFAILKPLTVHAAARNGNGSPRHRRVTAARS